MARRVSSLAWKQSVYDRFRSLLPADTQSDAFFKIFYSDIRPAPIAIVGLNPGGDPLRPPHFAASRFYENNEHDYVDCSYRIAGRMRDFLLRSGIAPALDDIRAIPKLNVIFHRSPRFE